MFGCLSLNPSMFCCKPVAIQSDTSDFLTMWTRSATFWPAGAAVAAGAAWVAVVAVGAAAGAVVGAAAAGAWVGAAAAGAWVGAAAGVAAAGAWVGAAAGAAPLQAASKGIAMIPRPPSTEPRRMKRR